MRVCILGATGSLGLRTGLLLSEAGHDVVGLVRDDDGAETIRKLGGAPQHGNVLDSESVRSVVEKCDVVVQAATKMPVDPPTTPRDWRRNDRVRLAATRNVLKSARDTGVEQIVLPSVVWAVDSPSGTVIDETSPPNPDRTTASAIECERLVKQEARDSGFKATVLRFGWFYGPNSAQTRSLGKQLLKGDLPVIGSGPLGRGETTISAIHVHDAARAVVAAIESCVNGVYHVVDDLPVTTTEFFEEFADRLEAPEPGQVPGWLATYFIGEDMVRFLTSDYPTANSMFSQHCGWEPTYPTVHQGLENVVCTWLDEGVLQPTPDGYRWATESVGTRLCRNCGRSAPPVYQECPHCKSPNLRPLNSRLSPFA